MKYTIRIDFDSKSKTLPEAVSDARVLSLVINKLSPEKITRGNCLVLLDNSEQEFTLTDLQINCEKTQTLASASNISQKELDQLQNQIKILEKELKTTKTKLLKINQLSYMEEENERT